MKNKEIKVGMAVRIKHIVGPKMLVVSKTPGLVGSSIVSCIWFSKEDVQQQGIFKAEQLEEIVAIKDLSNLLEDVQTLRAVVDMVQESTQSALEDERLKLQNAKRAEGDGTGFVKFGETKSPRPVDSRIDEYDPWNSTNEYNPWNE